MGLSMRVLFAAVSACLLTTLLAACDSPSAKVTQFRFGTANTLATTGNLRLVSERPRPGPDGSLLPVVCTEPSPDYAIAFGRSGSANVNVAIPEKATVGGGGSFTQTEVATELEGRAPAVLALRDGLFAACQAYANGVIGHDAYSMILSQYGTLLVALVAEKPSATAGGTDPARRATLSAMLVACIGRHDGTRIPQGENRLLSEPFCRRVLAAGLNHALTGRAR
jgi:hypothetical protein